MQSTQPTLLTKREAPKGPAHSPRRRPRRCVTGPARLFSLGLLFAAVVGGVCVKDAQAQLQYGAIQGTVTNRETGKALAGVTVVVTGPSLQGEQTEFTDPGGRYQITDLPSGDNFVVRFYFNDVVVERPNVRITQNKTLTISIPMPTQKGDKKAYVIKERAPSIDTASADTRVEINQELLRNTAVRGRTTP